MNWPAFGGSEFFIPAGIQIEAGCPLSRSITEWYPEWRGLWGVGEGYLFAQLSPPREGSPRTHSVFSFGYFLAITTKSLPVEKSS